MGGWSLEVSCLGLMPSFLLRSLKQTPLIVTETNQTLSCPNLSSKVS